MSKAWPRPLGALAGFVFLALFVVVPEGQKLGWPHQAMPYFLEVGAIAGCVGAVAGWLLVVIRNRLMVQK
jgi:hypothetical protein